MYSFNTFIFNHLFITAKLKLHWQQLWKYSIPFFKSRTDSRNAQLNRSCIWQFFLHLKYTSFIWNHIYVRGSGFMLCFSVIKILDDRSQEYVMRKKGIWRPGRKCNIIVSFNFMNIGKYRANSSFKCMYRSILKSREERDSNLVMNGRLFKPVSKESL